MLLSVPFRNLPLAVVQQSFDDLQVLSNLQKYVAGLSARLDLVPHTKANGGED
jgi:hypothetical protein